METLLINTANRTKVTAASTIGSQYASFLELVEGETFYDLQEKRAFLKEVYLLLEDGRIQAGFLYATDLLRLYRALASKSICGSQMASRVLNLMDQLSFVPTCASLWKVIFKRLSIDELPTLVFILKKAQTKKLYQFVGNSYLFKMTKEELLCLHSLIELSELYTMIKVKGKYSTPSPREVQAPHTQEAQLDDWDYFFSLS